MKKTIKLVTLQKIRSITMVSLIVITTVLSIVVFSVVMKSQTDSLNRADLILNSNRFMDGSAYLTSQVRSYAATGNSIHYDNYWNEVNNLKNRDIGVQNMKDIGITEEEEALITDMSNLSNQLIPLEEQAMEAVKNGDTELAIELVFGADYEESIGEILALQTKFNDMVNSRTLALVSSSNSTAFALQVMLFVMLFLIGITQFITESIMKRRMVLPIAKCSTAISEISAGNLSPRFDVESNASEIGVLAEATKNIINSTSKIIIELNKGMTLVSKGDFTYKNINQDIFVGDYQTLAVAYKKIVKDLPDVLAKINVSSSEVYSASEQLATGAMDLAEASTSQADSVHQLLDTIEAVSSEMTETNLNSQKAKLANQKTQAAILENSKQIREMTKAMSEINTKSGEISKIIKVIDDIAFQTNILSLNASVEAARAGSAGKGFAVVAEEVRHLATKSAESAKNTAILIDKTIKVVNNGNKIVQETYNSIETISNDANELSMLVDSIAISTQRQAESSNTLVNKANDISQIVQTNAATAEENTALSEQLAKQSQLLKKLITKFEIGDISEIAE